MPGKPCYSGPSPIEEEDRIAMWKWAKDEGLIQEGVSLNKVKDAMNQYFFGGQAKPEWMNDVISGRKTPFRLKTMDMKMRQYARDNIVRAAREMTQNNNTTAFGKAVSALRWFPRAVTVAGHGIVFPITHAGDLLLRPLSWDKMVQGLYRTYRGVASTKYTAKIMDQMRGDDWYEMAIHTPLDVGPKSGPVGIINTTGTGFFEKMGEKPGIAGKIGRTMGSSGSKTGYLGSAARAWDMLTVLRFELWKKQMQKYVEPGMSDQQIHEIGTHLAEWANHATGSGKGKIADLGGQVMFGPKLTQAKINRLTTDPAQTIKTFTKMLAGKEVTPGEKAVAWTRLSGATQYTVSKIGFLMANQAVLTALGSNQKVNLTDPDKPDYFAFQGGGLYGYVPGMHTEIRTLAKLMALTQEATSTIGKKGGRIANPDLHGGGKMGKLKDIAIDYATAKLEPGIQRGLELGTSENYQGRPVPWSSDPGTAKKPKMSWGEYFAAGGPIPLSGTIGYVYDQMKRNGMSAIDALKTTKGLIIFGSSLPGLHVKEEHPTAPVSHGSGATPGAVSPGATGGRKHRSSGTPGSVSPST